jgi:hypothetical protein
LINRRISEDLVHSKYSILISYKVDVESHDGYCSDPCDKTTSTKKVKKTYALLKTFDNDDFDDETGEVLNNEKLKLYHRGFEVCDKGSGYCGTGSNYKIVSAKIIHKKSKKIDLEN